MFCHAESDPRVHWLYNDSCALLTNTLFRLHW